MDATQVEYFVLLYRAGRLGFDGLCLFFSLPFHSCSLHKYFLRYRREKRKKRILLRAPRTHTPSSITPASAPASSLIPSTDDRDGRCGDETLDMQNGGVASRAADDVTHEKTQLRLGPCIIGHGAIAMSVVKAAVRALRGDRSTEGKRAGAFPVVPFSCSH